MVQPHCAAVEEIVARVNHSARQRRHDGRAGRGGNVHAAVRIAGLPVEHPPQAKRAGAPPRCGLAHVQGRQGAACGFAPGGHDAGLVVAFAFIAGLVLGRQVYRAGRDGELLLRIPLGGHGVVNLPCLPFGRCGQHRHVGVARGCGQWNAQHGRPLDGVAHHQHGHIRITLAHLHAGPLRCGAQRQPRHAARHCQRAGPDTCGLGPLLGRQANAGQRCQGEGREQVAAVQERHGRGRCLKEK